MQRNIKSRDSAFLHRHTHQQIKTKKAAPMGGTVRINFRNEGVKEGRGKKASPAGGGGVGVLKAVQEDLASPSLDMTTLSSDLQMPRCN